MQQIKTRLYLIFGDTYLHLELLDAGLVTKDEDDHNMWYYCSMLFKYYKE